MGLEESTGSSGVEGGGVDVEVEVEVEVEVWVA